MGTRSITNIVSNIRGYWYYSTHLRCWLQWSFMWTTQLCCYNSCRLIYTAFIWWSSIDDHLFRGPTPSRIAKCINLSLVRLMGKLSYNNLVWCHLWRLLRTRLSNRALIKLPDLFFLNITTDHIRGGTPLIWSISTM